MCMNFFDCIKFWFDFKIWLKFKKLPIQFSVLQIPEI